MAKTKTIATFALILYIVSGAGAFLLDNIYLILVLRAFLGISVGMLMPLSTGLLALYYPPEMQGKLMGLSAATNQAGGMVAMFLAGILANLGWNYAFLVYLMGLLGLILVWANLPSDKIESSRSSRDSFPIRKFIHTIIAMFLVMTLFFIYPTNFALIAAKGGGFSTTKITLLMLTLEVTAIIAGAVFGNVFHKWPKASMYIAPLGFLLGYFILSLGFSISGIIIGSFIVGAANGIGIPLLNTIASIKGGKNAASTILPYLSAALYLGQFLSPFIINGASDLLFQGDIMAPYKCGCLIAIIFVGLVYLNRHK